ncbi:GAF domain-containing protein [Thalassococcus sp. CAU 1522]|uniref:histidine kinase n=1 Tax=Thalassococcus arenae TaxID=2851652 RepID=A0ABS6N301_9RHOB|nr:GAF domain-containing protein [Thalassococcus arenae]MBV2358405.1 GAF domain-containing protein [Thalassococcus arenae]
MGDGKTNRPAAVRVAERGEESCETGSERQQEPASRALGAERRLAALDQAEVMDAEADPDFDRAVRLAGRLLGVPVSLVSFVDAHRQFFGAQQGLSGWACDNRGTPLSHSFCQHVVARSEPLIVEDARKHPLVRENKAVSDLSVIAYLGVPIRGPDGEVLGSFCAIDHKPRAWTAEDVAAMQDICASLETTLRLRDAIAESELIVQELNHRVKNLFTLTNGILRMERAAHDSAEALATSVSGRIQALAEAHALLVPVAHAATRDGAATTLGDLLGRLIQPHLMANRDRVALSGDPVELGPRSAVYAALAFHELVTNAAKYGALSEPEGHLRVQWRIADDAVRIAWDETVQKTSSAPPAKGGFGSRLLEISLERQLRGTIENTVSPGRFSYTINLSVKILEL